MDVRIEALGDYVLMQAIGPFDSREARAGLERAVRETRAAGLTHLLVDGRGISTTVPISERYDLATLLAGSGAVGLRIAVVVTTDNMFSKTMENTASNRGVALHTTDSIDEARAFLGLDAD